MREADDGTWSRSVWESREKAEKWVRSVNAETRLWIIDGRVFPGGAA